MTACKASRSPPTAAATRPLIASSLTAADIFPSSPGFFSLPRFGHQHWPLTFPMYQFDAPSRSSTTRHTYSNLKVVFLLLSVHQQGLDYTVGLQQAAGTTAADWLSHATPLVPQCLHHDVHTEAHGGEYAFSSPQLASTHHTIMGLATIRIMPEYRRLSVLPPRR